MYTKQSNCFMGRIPKFFTYSVIICLFTVACKSDVSNSIFSAFPKLVELEAEYNKAANAQTASNLMKELLETLKKPEVAGTQRTSFLEYGYKLAKDNKVNSRAATFLFPLIKEAATVDPNRHLELASILKSVNKSEAANTLYQSIVDNFPDSENAAVAKAAISDTFSSIDKYILDLGEKLFIDPDNTGINKPAAMKFVDACEAYALGYPNNPTTPDNLFKSAEVAKSLRTFTKSLSLYDWIIEKYPNYEKAPTALFLKGFIIENNVGDDAKAREIYDTFLAKYPQHDLADDVQFLIENIGKTDEEILEMIEAKRKDKETK